MALKNYECVSIQLLSLLQKKLKAYKTLTIQTLHGISTSFRLYPHFPFHTYFSLLHTLLLQTNTHSLSSLPTFSSPLTSSLLYKFIIYEFRVPLKWDHYLNCCVIFVQDNLSSRHNFKFVKMR